MKNGLIFGIGRFIISCGVVFGVLVFCIGGPTTMAFASTAFNVVGQGTGITLSAFGDFASGITTGRNLGGGTGTQAAPPAQPAN